MQSPQQLLSGLYALTLRECNRMEISRSLHGRVYGLLRRRGVLPAVSVDSVSLHTPLPPSDSFLATAPAQYSNNSSLPGGARAGATSGNTVFRPRWVRMRSITLGSVMPLSTSRLIPQNPHFSTSKVQPSFHRLGPQQPLLPFLCLRRPLVFPGTTQFYCARPAQC